MHCKKTHSTSLYLFLDRFNSPSTFLIMTEWSISPVLYWKICGKPLFKYEEYNYNPSKITQQMIQKFITQNTCKIPITSTIRFMDIKKKKWFQKPSTNFYKTYIKNIHEKAVCAVTMFTPNQVMSHFIFARP